LRVEALSDAEVKNEVMSVVRSMFPNVTIPEPTDFFFPRWNSNPLFRGSYSNWPPSFYIEHLDNLRANVGRLHFAGEATSRKYFGAFYLNLLGEGGDSYKKETDLMDCRIFAWRLL
jgi:polyamine oxidase